MTADTPSTIAHARISDCFRIHAHGHLVQCRDSLNLAGLNLSDDDLSARSEYKWPGSDTTHLIGLQDLVHLRYLDLTGNQLTKLPEGVSDCTELVWLGLNFNQIDQLPDHVVDLKKLQRLYLRGNQLKRLPAQMGTLNALVELDLNGNQLTELPASFIPLLEKGGAEGEASDTTLYLDLGNNPGQIATAAQQSRQTLLAFLRELNEAAGQPQGKLLLVGEGRVGKSSLLRALLNKPHDDKLLSTHGLMIETWEVDQVGEAENTVALNCWDFSGQEQMRETHQMFFSTPALYLLVWDPDRSQREAENELYEWLWLIHQSQRAGCRAQVLIVATNHRSRDRHEPDSKDLLMNEFGPAGAGILSGFASVESDDQHGERIGMDTIKAWVREQIATDSAFAQRVPALWENAILLCMDEQAPILPWDTFRQVCLRAETALATSTDTPNNEDLDVTAIARQMNALGRIVWYDDDAAASNEQTDCPARPQFTEKLNNHVILKPDWLSKAISYVFERAGKVPSANAPDTPLGPGLVAKETMDILWQNPGTRDESGTVEPGYDSQYYPLFRRIMQYFDLIQPLAPQALGHLQHHASEARHYLVPARLSRTPPPNWDHDWDIEGAVTMRFSLTSRGLHRGDHNAPLNAWLARAVFSRLIVRLHPLSQGREDVRHAAHWEQGLRLVQALGKGRLRARNENIYFEGHPYLLGQVDQALSLLLREMNQRFGIEIECSRSVACQPVDSKYCQTDLNKRCFFTQKKLDQLQQNHETIPCLQDDCNYSIDVARTLLGTHTNTSSIADRLDEIQSGVQRIDSSVRQMTQNISRLESGLSETITKLADAGWELTAAIEQKARNVLPDLKATVETVLRERDADQSRAGPALFSVEAVEKVAFWTDLGPRLAKKIRLHIYCEHTSIPISWFKHAGGQAPGVFEMEIPKTWLLQAKPFLLGIAQLLRAGAPLVSLIDQNKAALIHNVTDHFQTANQVLPSKAQAMQASPEQTAPTAPQRASGELLQELHQLLRQKLQCEHLDQAPGLGVVRVWNKAQNRHSWVHPRYQNLFG